MPDKFLARPGLVKAAKMLLGGQVKYAAFLTGLVAHAEAEAKRIARSEAYDEGDYHDSIHSEVVVDEGGPVGRVIADDWKALLIENGTVRRPANAPLRRSVEGLNLRIRRDRT